MGWRRELIAAEGEGCNWSRRHRRACWLYTLARLHRSVEPDAPGVVNPREAAALMLAERVEVLVAVLCQFKVVAGVDQGIAAG